MRNDGKAYTFIDLMGFNVILSNHLKINEVSEIKAGLGNLVQINSRCLVVFTQYWVRFWP